MAKKCKEIIKQRKKIKKFNIDNNPNKRRTNKYFTNEENNNREKLKNLNLNTDSKNYSFIKFKNKNFVKLKIISEVKEKSVIEKYKNILEYNDNEINSLSYQVALKKDKRTFFQYYLSLLRVGHPFLFSFYKNRDYNAQIIKIFLFFFFFAENFTINALFFNDETIHKIYIDQGSFNFIYQIPQVIYSSLISNIIDSLIKFLALSEDNIIKLKHIKKIGFFKKKKKILIKKLKLKFAFFFTATFILLMLFLYYITCFCGIYVNTQIHLIKDTSISFALTLLYPFGIYLLPGILRIYSLRSKKMDKKYSYKISILLQMIW